RLARGDGPLPARPPQHRPLPPQEDHRSHRSRPDRTACGIRHPHSVGVRSTVHSGTVGDSPQTHLRNLTAHVVCNIESTDGISLLVLVTACPGQGAQKAGFLTSWLELPGFGAALDELADASGIDLRTHGTASDDATITDTAVAQPLLVAAAIASYTEIFGDDLTTDIVAGHSVGEIGAAAIAGILTPAQAMTLVQTRGAAMADAAGRAASGMAAVVGGDPDAVLTAITDAGLEPANVNGGGQTVAAGAQDRIEAFAADPPERTRVIPLKVAGAF